MKYYKLEFVGGFKFGKWTWIECDYTPNKSYITLYDDDLEVKGIGIY